MTVKRTIIYCWLLGTSIVYVEIKLFQTQLYSIGFKNTQN